MSDVLLFTPIAFLVSFILISLSDWFDNKPARDMDKRIAEAHANRIKEGNK